MKLSPSITLSVTTSAVCGHAVPEGGVFASIDGEKVTSTEIDDARNAAAAHGLKQCICCRLVRGGDVDHDPVSPHSLAAMVGVPPIALWICRPCMEQRERERVALGLPAKPGSLSPLLSLLVGAALGVADQMPPLSDSFAVGHAVEAGWTSDAPPFAWRSPCGTTVVRWDKEESRWTVTVGSSQRHVLTAEEAFATEAP